MGIQTTVTTQRVSSTAFESAFECHAARSLTRRAFLGKIGDGTRGDRVGHDVVGSFVPERRTIGEPGVVDPLHWPARAKRVIFLCMAGGPSHLETLDYKPKLAEMHGQPMPESFTKGQPIAQLQGQKLTCLAPATSFRSVRQVRAADQHGVSSSATDR